jgi:hypothetical protein
MTLFRQKGWTVIINDDLISNTLSIFNLVVGFLVGAFGVIMKNANPDWFAGFLDDGSATAVAFLYVSDYLVFVCILTMLNTSPLCIIILFLQFPILDRHCGVSSNV